MQKQPKPVEFCGSALDDLRDFPLSARREAGYQIDKVQHGEEPDDWKPMKNVGAGVQEIRIRDEAGAFRVIYIAKLKNAVYVLHCFQKKHNGLLCKKSRWQARGTTNLREVRNE